MKLRLFFLTATVCLPLMAQVPQPVQTVGVGRAQPKFANSVAPSPIQNSTPMKPGAQPKTPVFVQNLGGRGPMPRATSRDAAEYWVEENSSATEATVDPETGMPRFKTTVTAHQSLMEPRRGEPLFAPSYKMTWLQNLMYTVAVMPDKPKSVKLPATSVPGRR